MAKNKSFNVQNLYDQLDEMRDFIITLLDDQDTDHTELRYLNDFIRFKKMDEEYQYFRENAHEEQEENLPFPHFTL